MRRRTQFATDRSGSAAVQFALIAAFAAVIVVMFALNIAYRS